MAGVFEMSRTAIDRLEQESVPRSMGREDVMSMFSVPGETGMAANLDTLADLPREHATPGGVNGRCLDQLRDVGWLRDYRDGLDAMKSDLEAIAAQGPG